MIKKEIKDSYTYYFADGTRSVVKASEVGQEWIDILYALDEEERKKNYNYGRHNLPLSALYFDGEVFIDNDADPHEIFNCKMEQQQIDEVISMLTKRQREVFELRYYEKRTQLEIANVLGINRQAVARIYKQAVKKIKKILEKVVAF